MDTFQIDLVEISPCSQRGSRFVKSVFLLESFPIADGELSTPLRCDWVGKMKE